MGIFQTIKVTGTWADGAPPSEGPGSISNIIRPFIETMVIDLKTDGVHYLVSDTKAYRLFVDQTSAQAFADLIVSAAAGLSRTDYSYDIADFEATNFKLKYWLPGPEFPDADE